MPPAAASAEPSAKVARMVRFDVDAHQLGGVEVHRERAHGAARPGALHEEVQAHHERSATTKIASLMLVTITPPSSKRISRRIAG